MRAWGASGSEGARLRWLCGKWEHFCAPHCGAVVSTAAGHSCCGPDQAATSRKKSTWGELRPWIQLFITGACSRSPGSPQSVAPGTAKSLRRPRPASVQASARSLSSSGLPRAGSGWKPRPSEGLGRRVQRGLRRGRGFACMRWVLRASRFSEEGVGSSLCGGVERPGRS